MKNIVKSINTFLMNHIVGCGVVAFLIGGGAAVIPGIVKRYKNRAENEQVNDEELTDLPDIDDDSQE